MYFSSQSQFIDRFPDYNQFLFDYTFNLPQYMNNSKSEEKLEQIKSQIESVKSNINKDKELTMELEFVIGKAWINLFSVEIVDDVLEVDDINYISQFESKPDISEPEVLPKRRGRPKKVQVCV